MTTRRSFLAALCAAPALPLAVRPEPFSRVKVAGRAATEAHPVMVVRVDRDGWPALASRVYACPHCRRLNPVDGDPCRGCGRFPSVGPVGDGDA